MRSHDEVLVELSPEQVVLSRVVRGRAEQPRALRLTSRVEGRIGTAVAAYREALTKLVMETGAQGMRARVLFVSPDAGAGVYGCARRAGAAAAERAAMLALGEATSLDVSEEPHAVLTVAVDERDAEGVAQIHTLGVACSDSEVETVRDIVESAGLKLAGAIPATGLGLLAGVSGAIPRSSKGVCIYLHMAERDSTIVGATNGRLRFVRQAPIGLESLVDVLSRDPMLDVSDAPHRLSREQARGVLTTQGIPMPGQSVEILPSVHSKAVLPLLQSTLQRLALEVKQSTRFGLSEADRANAELSVGGVGGSVGRLGAVVAEMSGLKALAEVAADTGAAGGTDLEVWSSQPELMLFPREVGKQRVASEFQKRFIAGALLALAALGVTWGKMRYDISQANAEIASLETPSQASSESQMLADQVRAANTALAGAKDSLQAAMSSRVRVQGLMLAIGESASKHVRLTNFEMDAQDGGGVARVSGKVMPEAGREGASLLGAFIDALSATPTVRSCKLASTRKGTGQDEGAIFFEMAVEVVRLPGSSMLAIDEPWEDGK